MSTLEFGMTKQNKIASLYILKNKNHMSVEISDFGARIVSIKVPGYGGKIVDVVLGYDTVEAYEKDPYCFGATIGRNANRIKNAQFKLNNVVYHLYPNENGNNLHSGPNGFEMRLWHTEYVAENEIQLSLISPDMDQGFPGKLQLLVTYTLTDDNALKIHYRGVSTEDTVVNLTQHSYFNLNGHNSGNILGQYLRIYSKRFAMIEDEQSIPYGATKTVFGTPMDFLRFKKMGQDIAQDDSQLKKAGDYNHSFYIDKPENTMGLIAEAYSNKTGIHMCVYSDLPCMQFYTGVYIQKTLGKGQSIYLSRAGFCLEPQYTPNAINLPKELQPILRKGELYNKHIVFQF